MRACGARRAAGERRAGAANWGSGCRPPLPTPRAPTAATRSDALQVRGGQSARAAGRSTPPHPPDIKPTILCGSNLIPWRASRDMDLDVRNVHWIETSPSESRERSWECGYSIERFRTIRAAHGANRGREFIGAPARARGRQYRCKRRSVRSLLRRSLWFLV